MRFPELSTGAKKSSQVCDLENRGFCLAIPTNTGKIDFSVLRGSAGVENSAVWNLVLEASEFW